MKTCLSKEWNYLFFLKPLISTKVVNNPGQKNILLKKFPLKVKQNNKEKNILLNT